MKNKTTIAIGIFFLVFVLVLVGSVSAKALLQKDESSLSVEEDIQYQSTLAAYEAQQEAYEQLIQQANEQLMEANETLAASSDSTESQVTETAGLTPEEAVVLAQAVAILPESLVGSPELVNFEGSVAYEVKYEEGAIYVSYVTGEILLNGTATLTDEITIELAEEIAKNYLGLSSLYLSDVVTVNGSELYRVIFTAGHFVYIDQTGQIVYVQMHVEDDSQPTTPTYPGDDDDDDHHQEEDDDDYDDDHEEDDD